MPELKTHQIGVGINQSIRVDALDDLDRETKTHYLYQIYVRDISNKEWANGPTLRFQRGSHIRRDQNTGTVIGLDINGLSPTCLLAVLVHHLQGLQSGPSSSRENALAITHLEESLHWLQSEIRKKENS